ncbi:MAG: hypothetical protein LCH84_11885 [Gemmatimonadetes bacterium]|nr:hypothetical protein [Gemmatimonadota bacterium]
MPRSTSTVPGSRGPRARPHARRLVEATTLALAALLAASAPARAQAVVGVGDDAVPLAKGAWRLTIAGRWNDARERFVRDSTGGTSRRGILSPLAASDAGVGAFPALTGVESAIRAASGNTSFRLSLGTLEASGEVHQSIAPLSAEYGITRRLSMRLVLPYVESRDASQLLLNRSGAGANVGLNPVYQTTGGAGVRATNGALLAQIDASRTALESELARCAVPTELGCDAIRANPGAAQTLLASAQSLRATLATLYGGAEGGAPLVPLAGSVQQEAVVARVGALRTAFQGFGVGAMTGDLAPTGSSLVIGPGGTPRLGTDTLFGVGFARLGNTRRAGVGDIDLTATWLLFDHFGADQRRRLLDNGRGLRSTITAGWRFGTAGADRTDDPFDVPIGDGANALLLRSTTDLVWSRSVWASGTVRLVKPLSDQVALALPTVASTSPFAPYAVVSADRSLGSRLDVEFAPRVGLGQFFGLSGAVAWQRWSDDRYRPLAAGDAPASLPEIAIASRSLSSASFGASFSTLASYVRGRSRIAAEVLYSHAVPLAASGEMPAWSIDRLEVRIYTGFPRR